MAEMVAEAPPTQIASSPQALLVIDDDRVCVEASLGACRLLGLGRSEVTGQPVEALFEPASGERFEQVWRAFRSSGGHAEPFALDLNPLEYRVRTLAENIGLIHAGG